MLKDLICTPETGPHYLAFRDGSMDLERIQIISVAVQNVRETGYLSTSHHCVYQRVL